MKDELYELSNTFRNLAYNSSDMQSFYFHRVADIFDDISFSMNEGGTAEPLPKVDIITYYCIALTFKNNNTKTLHFIDERLRDNAINELMNDSSIIHITRYNTDRSGLKNIATEEHIK